MPDDGLRAKLREGLRSRNTHFQSIETAMTGGGVPDCNLCAEGVETWVECKATSTWTVDIRPAQLGWIKTRLRHGGRVILATRRRHTGGPRKGPAEDQLWLHSGHDAVLQAQHGLQYVQPLALYGGGPARWDWAEIYFTLFHRAL